MEKYKELFMIVVSSGSRDLILMLERPLFHYCSAPFNHWLIVTGNLFINYAYIRCYHWLPIFD